MIKTLLNMDQQKAENPTKKRRVLKPSKHLKTVCGTPVPTELRKSLRTLKKRFSEMENRGIFPHSSKYSFKDALVLVYWFDLFYLRHGVDRLKLRKILNYVLFSVLVDSKVLTMFDIVSYIDVNNYAHIRKDIVLLSERYGFLEIRKKREFGFSYSVYPSTYLLRCLEQLLKEVD